MEAEQLRRQIGELLTTELERTRALAVALDAGRAVFAGRDAYAIERTATEVQRLVSEVEASEKRRQKVLAAVGLPADKDGMEQFLARLDRDGQLSGTWQELLAGAAECQRLNLANAAVIETNRHFAETALRILRGQSPDQETYGRRGTSSAPGGASSRPLGKA
jgi:flagella synthesis protein FlgN